MTCPAKKRNLETPNPSSLAEKLHEFVKSIGHMPWRFFPEDKGWECHNEFKPKEGLDLLFATRETQKRLLSVDIDLNDGQMRVVPNAAEKEYASFIVGPNHAEGSNPEGIKVWKDTPVTIARRKFRGDVTTCYNSNGELAQIAFSARDRRRETDRVFTEMDEPENLLDRLIIQQCTIKGFTDTPPPSELDLTAEKISRKTEQMVRIALCSASPPRTTKLLAVPFEIKTPEELFELVRKEVRRLTRKKDII